MSTPTCYQALQAMCAKYCQALFCAAMAASILGAAASPVMAQSPGPGPSRQLAPGILTVIPPKPEEEEMVSGPTLLAEIPAEISELDYTPNFTPKSATLLEQAKAATLRRTIWNLEFAFKPMRMIIIDVPQTSGKAQKKLIWYMVYRVKNNGGHLSAKEAVETVTDSIEHKRFEIEKTNEVEVFGRKGTSLRFFPQFVLASREYEKSYLDRVIPAAMAPIKAREFPGDKQVALYDSLAISEVNIPLSDAMNDRSVWGVVTWEDVDPRIDYFSVYVQGLTNAYKYEDPVGAFTKGSAPGTGRKFTTKTLQLNFWRPGDAVAQNEDEIRYGVRLDSNEAEQQRIFALYGVSGRLDHLWLYQ
ncbi:hypothetical protein Psta_1897 [Pirellula staleyi DSM 6068]|uniref:Uncharacterized protein n=1 Tax=Pirellula staleyi (strain ATCC 27377 / DSM 6068 / ICPB 4128) TaxID=530564 RepID=D2QZT8_PIRSD|nr:hypothetical protein Psta_1897 [Pirellula staleyi DSM 6068]